MKIKSRHASQLTTAQVWAATVLIVEPNPYHGEILPGFVHLFQKLGYNVRLLVRNEVFAEDPFCRFENGRMPEIFVGSAEEMKAALLATNTKKYEVLFFSTNVLWERGRPQTDYLSFLGSKPEGKIGNLYVEHNLTYLDEDKARKDFENGRVFTLLKYSFEGTDTKLINPHFFGKTRMRQTTPDAVKKVLVLGSSSRDEVNLRRLFTSIREVKQKGLDFNVSIVGDTIEIPADLKQKVTVLGRLGFADYYKVVEDHHYLLTLIDLDSSDIIHTKYSQGTTSGTVQISLGFNRPMIIDEKHAATYGFDSGNAIVYKGSNLTEGLCRALILSPVEYEDLQSGIDQFADGLTRDSIQNVKAMMGFSGKRIITSFVHKIRALRKEGVLRRRLKR